MTDSVQALRAMCSEAKRENRSPFGIPRTTCLRAGDYKLIFRTSDGTEAAAGYAVTKAGASFLLLEEGIPLESVQKGYAAKKVDGRDCRRTGGSL